MDKREEEEIMYGCFMCGVRVSAPDDLIRPTCCEECGNPYLITYQEALDIINDLYLKKKFKPQIIRDDEESYMVDENNE